MVSPIEPFDGYLGEGGEEHWGPYLQPNWIGFRLAPDDRYELLGDFRFFAVENTTGKESYTGARRELEEAYKTEHASYLERKKASAETGQVTGFWSTGQRKKNPALSHLGGRAPVCNMIFGNHRGAPKSAFTYTDEDAAPRTTDGRLYEFIAAVPGYYYRNAGADEIILYYDPVERVALQTFVFT